MQSAARGFSLYELVMTVAIAAIVLGIGAPSLGSFVADARLRAETDALFHAVHRARKRSLVHRRVVSLCPSTDGATCTPDTDWSGGWILFENADRDEPPERDPGEALLAVRQVDARVRIVANRRGFTLRSIQQRATNGTFVICDRNGRAQARALVVSYTGRPRVARENGRGEPYDCAD